MSVVVVYDHGAVSPTDILQRVGMGRELVVVLASSDHAKRMRPLFAEACVAVYDLADDDLVRQLARHEPTGILTFSEPMLTATSELASALGRPHYGADVVEALTHKHAQRERLRDAGVDRTVSVRLTSASEWDTAVGQVGLPAVVKPVRGVSSRNTFLVDSHAHGQAQIAPLLEEEGEVVVEEYLRGVEVLDPFGDYVSVETIVQHGEQHHVAVTGKFLLMEPFRESGQFWPALLDTTTRHRVTELTDQAVKALNVVSGILHTEIKLTRDGPRIIEVNGRVGGYIPELARHAASIDLVDAAARIACGERVDIPPVNLDRVYFQFSTPAPVEPGVVSAIPDRAALADIPGFVRFTPLVRPGTRVGGVRTHELDLVEGEAPDHESLVSTINMIMDRIEYRFESNGQDLVHGARDLVYNTTLEVRR